MGEMTAGKDREKWMDLLRGIAIVLVIANHSIYNAAEAYDTAPAWLVTVNDILSPVRMPLMVFLSGLLLAKSLNKTRKTYLVGKLRTIAWPFLVWTVIAIGYEAIAGLAMDGEARIVNPLMALIAPLGHLWFLQYLLAYYLLALVLRAMHPLIPAGVALLGGIFAEGDWDRFLMLFACFMVGAWASEHRGEFSRLVRSNWAAWIAATMLVILVVLGAVGADLRGLVRYETISAPFVFAAVILTARWSMAVQEHGWTRPLRFVGLRSLVFYLVHGYPVILGVALGVRLGWSGVVIGFLAGMGTSIVAALIYTHWRPFRVLFEFPKRGYRVSANHTNTETAAATSPNPTTL